MNAPGLARTYSMSIVGIEGHLVDVETYAGSGLVAFTLVGLLDTSVREARDRVRAAFESCGLDVLDQRITVNLSPAGIPKSGSAFDLAIAASVALATGLVSPLAFED
ncbi:MAG: magnesium chelatase domain-containing protein, partial [Pauljensenia sp.]